jgi:hypothetical protein
MKKTPLQEVKEKFGSKENLIKELKKVFDAGNMFENRLNVDKGISTVSNAKLLKLFQVAEEVKGRFSTRANLIDDMLKVLGRVKDEGLKSKLEKWSLPRLWDHYQSVAKNKDAARNKQAEKQ